MTLSNILLGLGTGIPIMIVVGPIAMLLIEQGMDRGLRGAWPAAAGVVAADFAFSAATGLAGVAIARALDPLAPLLTVASVAVLVAVAVRLWLSARRDLAVAPEVPAAQDAPAPAAVLVGAGAPVPAPGPVVSATPAASPLGQAAAFFSLTMVNPVALALMASIVLGGGAGTGSPGWVLGMTLASVMVSGMFVAVGHALGALLSATTVARVRMAAAVLIGAMALHFALV